MTPLPPSPTPAPADIDERALTLLLKAIDTLPAEERGVVLMFLLKRGFGAASDTAAFMSVGSSVQGLDSVGLTHPGQPPSRPDKARLGGFLAASGLGGAQQMVPVRFSADSHRRLRTWCGDNGFPMAAVVRGLVDQFLEAQRSATA